MVLQSAQSDPLFGRPGWTYVNVVRGPARGPQPKLARGSGQTGAPGTQSALPSYVSQPDYHPSEFDYQQTLRESFVNRIPRTIFTGDNGRELVGTYQPHDFTIGQRFNHQMRRSHAWQDMSFPPDFRAILQYQQVMKYRVNSITQSARVLDSSNYFLGYQVTPQVAAKIGGSTLGNMGSQ